MPEEVNLAAIALHKPTRLPPASPSATLSQSANQKQLTDKGSGDGRYCHKTHSTVQSSWCVIDKRLM
ncbi:hypothetical protein E2C01_069846 [Portunus trituberculatus]|uniref:Uncharacterized protein n=1 Tax=Portunus trituberculatus TaxID=210409 RepID=A0A5B7I3E6_PORTR|nr:hypothetical protein [Portunus trituberculatus]